MKSKKLKKIKDIENRLIKRIESQLKQYIFILETEYNYSHLEYKINYFIETVDKIIDDKINERMKK